MSLSANVPKPCVSFVKFTISLSSAQHIDYKMAEVTQRKCKLALHVYACDNAAVVVFDGLVNKCRTVAKFTH